MIFNVYSFCVYPRFWIQAQIWKICHDFDIVFKFPTKSTSWNQVLWNLVVSNIIPGDSWYLRKFPYVSWFFFKMIDFDDFWSISGVLMWGEYFGPPLIRMMSALSYFSVESQCMQYVRYELLWGCVGGFFLFARKLSGSSMSSSCFITNHSSAKAQCSTCSTSYYFLQKHNAVASMKYL